MADRATVHDTFVIERNYPKTPQRVFAAFADAAKKRRWFADGGDSHQVEEYTLDFRIGGSEQVQSRFQEGSPFPGVALTSSGTHLDIVPDRRVVIASTMSVGDRRISAALLTFELVPVESGTQLVFTHQAAFFEGADGPKMRQDGWRKLLDRLDLEVSREGDD